MTRRGGPTRAVDALTLAGTVLAVTLTTHTAANLRQLRRPAADPPDLTEPISVLLPVRNEAPRVAACIRATLLALDACRGPVELVILDDGSTDGTADEARRAIGSDPRARLVSGLTLPSGWLGKAHACQQLAEAADPRSSILIFIDADVLLAPTALPAAVDLLRHSGLDLACPYPRQLCQTAAERLVQPLLQWSWLTTLPLRLAEHSRRGSLSAGNGQFLVVDRATYQRAGGHAAVRTQVLEDIALVRSVKAVGGRAGVVDGTELASCRMYDGWPDLRDGYAKSLWSAFGSRRGAVAANAVLLLAYVVPPAALVMRRSRVGLIGYAAGVGGRLLVARRTGQRAWPDPLAHPVSISMLAWLSVRSWRQHARGQLTWKGRPLP